MIRSAPMTKLRKAIEEAGGLFSQAGLARRWRVSNAYISEAAQRADFPEPAAHIDIDRPVWTGKEADDWRATPRKPGPRAAS